MIAEDPSAEPSDLEDLSITAGDHTTGLMQRKIFFVVV
jgi:hypothetical protein